jgi:hypothetical protein
MNRATGDQRQSGVRRKEGPFNFVYTLTYAQAKMIIALDAGNEKVASGK